MPRNLGFLLLASILACAGSSARAAEVVLQPVGASGNHTIDSTEIILEGGEQRVRLDVKVRGFAPDLLKTFQAKLDSSGYSNTSLIRLRAAVLGCPSADAAGNRFCRNAHGEAGIGAPRCVDVDFGPRTEFRCESGWINQSRTDWLMFGHASVSAVDVSTADYRWGSTTEPGDEVVDGGLTYYAGTLMVDVPAGAVGSYVIGWDDDESYWVSADDYVITPLLQTAATITIRCTQDAQCDDRSDCTEEFCDLQTQICTNTPYQDGTACVDDGDACTTGNVCSQGKCGDLLVCPFVTCHLPRTCDPQTGCPSLAPGSNFSWCDDGNYCTHVDFCLEGVCIPGVPRPDGQDCNDGNPCTLSDGCKSGTCVGVPRTCTNGNACNNPGVCVPETGECTMVPKPDGTACDDVDLCTANQCEQGVCEAAEIPDCVQWQDMFGCIQGPQSPKEPDCDPFDLNDDGFVDLLDVGMVLESY